MMDIKAWLEENGMGEHWEKFESNKIDEDTLKSMTENDLKDIGIDALGDRKKIREAINVLSGGSSSGGAGKGALIGGLIGFTIGFGAYSLAGQAGGHVTTAQSLIIGIFLALFGAILGAIIKK